MIGGCKTSTNRGYDVGSTDSGYENAIDIVSQNNRD